MVLRMLPLSMLLPLLLVATAPDRIMVEAALNENRKFMEFLNVPLSNFCSGGVSAERDRIRRAYSRWVTRHFVAYKMYLSGAYPDSMHRIYQSQRHGAEAYLSILDDVILPDTWQLLNRNTRQIVAANDARANHQLKLGYRDLKRARIMTEKARSTERGQYSVKISLLIEATKLARSGKRYALLALIESRIPPEEKIKRQSLNAALGLEAEEAVRVREYERRRDTLANMLNLKLFENNYDFFLHHDDAFGYIRDSNRLDQISAELTNPEVTVFLEALEANPQGEPELPGVLR